MSETKRNLTQKDIDLFTNLHSELAEQIYHVWDIGRKYKFFEGSINHWVIEDENVYIEWSDTWSYGGHDCGTKSFSTDLLLGGAEEHFSEQRRIEDKVAADRVKAEEKRKRKERRMEFEKLKKEFEG